MLIKFTSKFSTIPKILENKLKYSIYVLIFYGWQNIDSKLIKKN